MSGQSTFHDGNHAPVLSATSSVDGKSVVLVWADPVTHRLLVSASSSATTTVYTETPSGLINGSNTTYTTVHTINNIFSMAINGTYLHPQDVGAGTGDYTVSGSTITFLTALPSSLAGTSFTVVYQ